MMVRIYFYSALHIFILRPSNLDLYLLVFVFVIFTHPIQFWRKLLIGGWENVSLWFFINKDLRPYGCSSTNFTAALNCASLKTEIQSEKIKIQIICLVAVNWLTKTTLKKYRARLFQEKSFPPFFNLRIEIKEKTKGPFSALVIKIYR